MAILSDFVRIVGDESIVIGDNNNESGFTRSFRTADRREDRSAYISFMLKGMTGTNDNAEIFVNDRIVGLLLPNNGGNPDHWQTQTISLEGNQLEDGNNILRVGPVASMSGSPNNFDDFTIRNVYCHFHQDS